MKKTNVLRRGWNEAECQIYTPAKDTRSKTNFAKNSRTRKGVIPIFFATDDNYLPFLAITLQSLYENCSKNYEYKIYVLNTGVRAEFKEKILRYSKDGFSVRFVDVSKPLQEIAAHLHMRDYYTTTTYFRIFIASMFPQYDKAIYLDCDTVVLGDIANLYEIELADNLIAGAPCEGVNSFHVYKKYVREVTGLNPDYYFNAGVLLMNLKAFREEGFYTQFAKLLQEYKFTLIQDQDYLNVLCQDRVLRLPRAWNKSPVAKDLLAREELCIVHYLMTWKPWHYADVPYGEYFWEYAKKTEFYDYIHDLFLNFSEQDAQKDRLQEANLKQLARTEIARDDGYYKTHGKRYGNVWEVAE